MPVTRCRHCQTVFRVTPEQVRAHGGQVRCGRCMQIFNALATLMPDPVPDPAAAGPTAAAAPERPVPAEAATPAAVPAIEPAPEPAPEPTPEPTPEPAPETAPALTADTPAAEPEIAPLPADPAPDAANPFISDITAVSPAVAQRPRLVAACVALLAVLLLQAAYFYRGELAAQHPLLRQWAYAACAAAGCTVRLPQQPKAVVIEASDLQVMDPARPQRIQLTATLRNHAGHAVGYPALDLVLTNANDHTLARRIFLPAEYLGTGRDPNAGIAANAELTVRLALDTGTLGAAGFRFTVLAAPRG